VVDTSSIALVKDHHSESKRCLKWITSHFPLSSSPSPSSPHYLQPHNILLQIDIDSIANWANTNFLSFSAPKCNVVSFTRAKQTITYQYLINGNTFNRMTQIKDLGVILDSKMTFHQRVNDLSSRSYKLLGFVIRNSHSFQNPLTLRLLSNHWY